jgi:hypothetical protein
LSIGCLWFVDGFGSTSPQPTKRSHRTMSLRGHGLVSAGRREKSTQYTYAPQRRHTSTGIGDVDHSTWETCIGDSTGRITHPNGRSSPPASMGSLKSVWPVRNGSCPCNSIGSLSFRAEPSSVCSRVAERRRPAEVLGEPALPEPWPDSCGPQLAAVTRAARRSGASC